MKVLVVDDEELARTTVRAVLGRAGHEVRLAASVDEAWCHLQAWTPDCVVVDQRLPDGAGAALVEDLRGEPSLGKLRVVLMSGDLLSAEAIALADVFLLKPVGARALMSAVAGSDTT